MLTLDDLQALDDTAFNRAIAEAAGTVEHDYAHDLNAAWALCAALPMAVVDVRFFTAQRGGYVQISPCDGLQIDFGGQPARALSTAWYAWLLEQRERKE